MTCLVCGAGRPALALQAAAEPLDLPFDEAIRYFEAKTRVPTARWTDVYAAQHARAFMSAGAATDALLADLQAGLVKALREGTSLEEWRRDFDAAVARYGWSYHGTRAWRSELIYSVNLATAYSAGRYAQMTDPDVLADRPYWQYRHGHSRRPRPHHLALDGTIRPHDDALWTTHWPPNGWRCSCYVVALSERQVRAAGGVSPPPRIPWEERTIRTGEGRRTILVPAGIDPGFEYNVGAAGAAAAARPGESWRSVAAGVAEEGARRRVAAAGRLDGHEHLEAYDRDLGATVAALEGGADRVDVPPRLAAELARSDRRIAIVHNHPRDSALSPGDLTALRFPGVAAVRAEGHAGTASVAERGPRWPDPVGLALALTVGNTEAVVVLRRHVTVGRLTAAEAGRLQSVLLQRALAEAGLIAGDVQLGPDTALVWQRRHAQLTRAVTRIAKRIMSILPPSAHAQAEALYPRMLIDPPSEFAPREEWERHLAGLRAAPSCPEVAAAIAHAEQVLSGAYLAGIDRLIAERGEEEP